MPSNEDDSIGLLLKVLVISLVIAAVIAVTVRIASAHEAPDPWQPVRVCESHNNYATNTGNGFYGAYQFNQSTWNNNAPGGWVGVRPSDAPPHIQDQAAETLRQRRGLQPWPICGRLYGSNGYTTPLPARTGHYGRPGDLIYECNYDGHGSVRVVRRANALYVDSNNNGGTHDIPIIGFGTSSDVFTCQDLDGDGDDEMIVHRGNQIFWGDEWKTGTGRLF